MSIMNVFCRPSGLQLTAAANDNLTNMQVIQLNTLRSQLRAELAMDDLDVQARQDLICDLAAINSQLQACAPRPAAMLKAL